MVEVEHDPTDQGVSRLPSEEDVAEMLRVRRQLLASGAASHGPPARAETRERVLERAAVEHGWSPPRRRLRSQCGWCSAPAGRWCRRGSRGEVVGHVHEGRDEG